MMVCFFMHFSGETVGFTLCREFRKTAQRNISEKMPTEISNVSILEEYVLLVTSIIH